MRNVKFMGLRTDMEGWVEGDLIHTRSGQACIGCFDTMGFKAVPVKEETLRESTGIPDKHGMDIFSGAIVRKQEYPFYDGGKYRYFGVVEWCEDKAAYMVRLARATSWASSKLLGLKFELKGRVFEVIGNRWDNRSLLINDNERG